MPSTPIPAAIIGAGPAGLMAAEALAEAGHRVEIFDAMPSPARKFLLAGKGGLNLTHSEPLDRFLCRYGARSDVLGPMVRAFGPEQLREWAMGLGIETFVGTSGRVFPRDFKAAPLLRSWLRRLKARGVKLHARHRWQGWDEGGRLVFMTPDGAKAVQADATILALGGASWPNLGSDGAWTAILAVRGIAPVPLRPANCGFDIGWSEIFRTRAAGQPIKNVVLSFAGLSVKGELMITETGIEGGAVYALSAPLRDALPSTLLVDLKPDWTAERLRAELGRPRGSRSLSSHVERTIGLKGAAFGLLREVLGEGMADTARLAEAVKALPLTLKSTRPIDEAISTAGGIRFEDLDRRLMIKALPGVFAAGEMLDWEAPTGGYLLTACFATGRAAGRGAAEWLESR